MTAHRLLALVLCAILAPSAMALAEPAPAPAPSPFAVARQRIAERLIDLHRDRADAMADASRLTDEDVAVLLANPKMLQAAGDGGQTMLAIIIGAAIITGIVLLAVHGSGSVMIHAGG